MLKQTYDKQLDALQQELNILRSIVMGTIGKDREGNYDSSFVKKLLKTSKEKPIYNFKDKHGAGGGEICFGGGIIA